MKCRIFTLLFAFLAIAGNAVWGQVTTIDVSASTNAGGEGQSYTFSYNESEDSRVLTINNPGNYTINNASGVEKHGNKSNVQIKITEVGTYNITLDNVKINAYLGNDLDGTITTGVGLYPERCAFEIGSGVIVNLDWKGTNTLWSGPQRAGINVKEGAKLVLKGTNSGANLEVGSYGNSESAITYGAGIGGDKNDPNFGTIIIESGKIEAYSRAMGNASLANGAGIGGGYSDNKTSSKGTIIIKGGDVIAQCNVRDYYMNGSEKGAGIGGGNQGTCDQIVIIGGANKDATTASVKVQSYSGADIGVGDGYTGSEQPEIIIGKWDEESTISVTESDNATLVVTDENYVDGYTENPSVTGNVTMLEGLQIYVEDLEVKEGATFNAYSLKLERTSFGEDHNVDWAQANDAQNYYVGKGVNIEIDALKCNSAEDKDLFLGWYNKDNVVTVADNKTTFTAESTPSQKVTYYAVWVESEHPIVVETETTWTKDDGLAPEINYVPNGSNNASNALTFTFEDLSTYPGLTDWKFVGNQILGKTELKNNDTYKELKLTATVKLGNGTTQNISIPVYIVEKSIINEVSINTNQEHVYTGHNHNSLGMNGQTHLLNVQMTKDLYGDPFGPRTLDEETHYRIYSYSFGGKPFQANDNDKKSVELINAGEYSNITIEALQATISADLDEAHGQKYTIKDQTVTIEQRPLGIIFSLKNESIEEGTVPTWNDVAIDIEKMNTTQNRGLVDGENIDVIGTIDCKLNEEGTKATITIKDIEIKAAVNSKFKESNYAITTNEGEEYSYENTEIVLTVPVVPKETEKPNNPGHIERPAKYYNIYIDTVCPGLKLELSKDVVKEGGQVSVYLTVEEQCDTTGFAFEYKRGLFGRWEDLKPLEGVQPGEYIIKHIYTDIYIRALDAIVEEEEEPTGIEDVEGVKVYAQDGNIYVYTPNRERVMIVSMNGALVKNAEQEGMQSYSVSRGIYIVRIGDKVFKIKN